MLSSPELGNDVRLHVYERFLADGRPPTHVEAALSLGITEADAAAAYQSLADQRVIVLAPGSLAVWMANPLSAYPTDFWVETPRGGYWGSCIWDAFGVIAMLGGTGSLSTQCPDCGDRMQFRVSDGELEPAEAVAHFAVPARSWWENIGYS